jgi:tetratricopeptide (TPR) repeat protein
MKKTFTRMAGLVLAFGFFFGCKSSSNLSETRALYDNRQLHEAAVSAGRIIRQNPDDGDARLLHGQILLDIAGLTEPGNRRLYYRDASSSLKHAAELFSASDPDKAGTATSLLVQRWTDEEARAARALEDSRSFDRDELTLPLQHAENAITLIPDSSSAYLIKSEIYYLLGDPGSAVITLEDAPDKNADIYERIGYFYALDDRHIEAADAFEQAYRLSTGNINLLYGLINTLIDGDNTEQAISRIGDLSAAYPDNPSYPALEGSLRFEQAERWLFERIDDGRIGNPGIISEGLALIDLAETSFRRASDLLDEDPDIHASIGFFYLNSGALLLDLSEFLEGNDKNMTEQRAAAMLGNAIPHLEIVARHGQDPAIWLSLHQIYSYLDMPDEADAALENAGQ